MTKKQKLELTWVEKERIAKLEPRILIEDATLSFHATKRFSDLDIFDNKLIFGDNLLALKALEQDHLEKIDCVYIDPPFNTGEAFENYDDGIEHSLWLNLMYERFKILHKLLKGSGSLFVHLNDDELDYCKVILDEVFGRNNFVNRITVEARSPSAFSTVNPGVFKSAEYILWYAKNKNEFVENSGRVPRIPDYAYNKWLVNPKDDVENWKLTTIIDVYSASPQPRSRRPDTVLEHFHTFIVDNSDRICRLASISDSGAGEQIIKLKNESLKNPGKVFKLKRDGKLDDVYVLDGQQLIFYAKNVFEIDGNRTATSLMSNVWKDIAWEGIANEGDVTFRKGKKPERLIRRCLELTTKPGDLVLDSFGGSGTTGAVAHKMGRRWIMIEHGEHCHTHIIPRLKKVITGDDQSGISSVLNWKGGGGFRYYKLAPSLLAKDKWGNWVINKEYDANMLAAAVCKHEGFTYNPSETEWWAHGYSTETDFIYVTTQTLTEDQLIALSEDVGSERSLLVCCSAYKASESILNNSLSNLTLKKMPHTLLSKCEWGKDDYSLNISKLLEAEDDHNIMKPQNDLFEVSGDFE